ncbi:hypothetical protein RhiirA1_466650 [Rhizophagus irregularis]|uniref:Uncharacterized protein n=1 Tax=Rhizophagus irregularis TaxID=588596 RepID=A0A2I1ETN5_9GLOM|nr:hypothetical protein RhiirA1_466650 [Rhizophagus irregularis]PKY25489.1 hypothetical protein RhiirB3_440448 [Rhizophagus irregularis]
MNSVQIPYPNHIFSDTELCIFPYNSNVIPTKEAIEEFDTNNKTDSFRVCGFFAIYRK